MVGKKMIQSPFKASQSTFTVLEEDSTILPARVTNQRRMLLILLAQGVSHIIGVLKSFFLVCSKSSLYLESDQDLISHHSASTSSSKQVMTKQKIIIQVKLS